MYAVVMRRFVVLQYATVIISYMRIVHVSVVPYTVARLAKC